MYSQSPLCARSLTPVLAEIWFFKSLDRWCQTKGPLPNLGRLTVYFTLFLFLCIFIVILVAAMEVFSDSFVKFNFFLYPLFFYNFLHFLQPVQQVGNQHQNSAFFYINIFHFWRGKFTLAPFTNFERKQGRNGWTNGKLFFYINKWTGRTKLLKSLYPTVHYTGVFFQPTAAVFYNTNNLAVRRIWESGRLRKGR